MPQTPSILSADWQDSPSVWFAVLEAALRRRDLAAAARAQRELRRLGYVVEPPLAAALTQEGRA